MTWGDVKTASGQEYLEPNERQTKTRSEEITRDGQKVSPKMFSVPQNERDPTAEYELGRTATISVFISLHKQFKKT